MRNYPFVFVQNCIILLFVVLACIAFVEGDPTELPLAGVVFWLALSGLLGILSDKASQDKNYRLLRLFTWATILLSSVVPAAFAGFLVGGLLLGTVGGSVILLANLAIYLFIKDLSKPDKK